MQTQIQRKTIVEKILEVRKLDGITVEMVEAEADKAGDRLNQDNYSYIALNHLVNDMLMQRKLAQRT